MESDCSCPSTNSSGTRGDSLLTPTPQTYLLSLSLTVCNPTQDSFQVAIIPYTFEHTNFHALHIGSVVNLEFDIIGKYLSRMMQLVG